MNMGGGGGGKGGKGGTLRVLAAGGAAGAGAGFGASLGFGAEAFGFGSRASPRAEIRRLEAQAFHEWRNL